MLTHWAVFHNTGVPGNFFGEGGGGVTPGIFCGGWGFQQIQLKTEGSENGDLGAVAP
jgi:hypothetical protein